MTITGLSVLVTILVLGWVAAIVALTIRRRRLDEERRERADYMQRAMDAAARAAVERPRRRTPEEEARFQGYMDAAEKARQAAAARNAYPYRGSLANREERRRQHDDDYWPPVQGHPGYSVPRPDTERLVPRMETEPHPAAVRYAGEPISEAIAGGSFRTGGSFGAESGGFSTGGGYSSGSSDSGSSSSDSGSSSSTSGSMD